MTAQNIRCVIMFVDVAGSTRLFEKLGDRAAQRTIVRCLGILSGVVRDEGGVVVKTIGDGIMTRFHSADAAVAAACRMQSAMDQNAGAFPSPMAIRVGMHHGSALLDHGDVFGDVVNVAARMMTSARPGQIMATREVVSSLSEDLSRKARQFDRARVKGKEDVITIFEVVWEEGELVTHLVNSAEKQPCQTCVRLRLRYREQEVFLEEHGSPFLIGRGDQCGLTVCTRLASRVHARIEYRRVKFVLIDESTNGTWVLTQEGEEIYLKREELPLSGAGVMSLGRPEFKQAENLIHFACL